MIGSYLRVRACALLPALAVVCASGQTRLDLRSQTKNVDFSSAVSTRPFVVGSALPPTCEVGEAWFKPDAPVGQNLFLCAQPNIWSVLVTGRPTVPYEMVRSVAPGQNASVICADGAGANMGQCTVAMDTGGLVTLDGDNNFGGITSFSSSAVQNLSATSTLVCNSTRIAVSSAAAVTLTATPTVADPPRDGQLCIVHNVGSYDITLRNGASYRLKLPADSATIPAGRWVMLLWDAAGAAWVHAVEGGASSDAVLAADNTFSAANVFSGKISFPAASVLSGVTAGSTIPCNAARVALSAASAVTITSAPTIADPSPARDGQVCMLQNVGASAITLTSGAAQNLKLSAATVPLAAGQYLTLVWDGATGLWTQETGGSTVEIASQPEAEAGIDGTKMMTPLRTKQAIDVNQRPLASQAEAEAGIDGTKMMTPLRTKQAIDVNQRPLASQAEAEAGTDSTKMMTPLRTKQSIDANQRPLASQAEAEAGTDNTKAMTPLRTRQEMDKFAPMRLLATFGPGNTVPNTVAANLLTTPTYLATGVTFATDTLTVSNSLLTVGDTIRCRWGVRRNWVSTQDATTMVQLQPMVAGSVLVGGYGASTNSRDLQAYYLQIDTVLEDTSFQANFPTTVSTSAGNGATAFFANVPSSTGNTTVNISTTPMTFGLRGYINGSGWVDDTITFRSGACWLLKGSL
jgi:hypothetical protein